MPNRVSIQSIKESIGEWFWQEKLAKAALRSQHAAKIVPEPKLLHARGPRRLTKKQRKAP